MLDNRCFQAAATTPTVVLRDRFPSWPLESHASWKGGSSFFGKGLRAANATTSELNQIKTGSLSWEAQDGSNLRLSKLGRRLLESLFGCSASAVGTPVKERVWKSMPFGSFSFKGLQTYWSNRRDVDFLELQLDCSCAGVMYTGGKDCAVIRWDIETGKKALGFQSACFRELFCIRYQDIFPGGRNRFECGGHFEKARAKVAKSDPLLSLFVGRHCEILQVLSVCLLEQRGLLVSAGVDRVVRSLGGSHRRF